MLSKIKDNILKYNLIKNNENVVIGFSGGADSALLVYALKKLEYNVYALHIHHGIRGEEADRDANFAKNFCKKYDIDFFEEKINIPYLAKENNLSLETCARIERYKLLNEYADKFNAKIAVAHNKNDQAETVLMHLLRGSGLNGLCGMQFKSGNIIRPILNISRNDIEKFNEDNNIEYVTDSTNNINDYTRNKIRLDVIPFIDESLDTDSISALTKCAETLNEYNSFINEVISQYEKKHIISTGDEILLKTEALPLVIKIELIKKCINLLNGNLVDIEKVHLEDICSLTEKNSGKEIHLPYGIKVKKIYDSLHFSKNTKTFFAEYFFEPEKSYQWKNKTLCSAKVENFIKEKDVEFIDLNKLPSDLVLRTRQEGDYIYPLGSSGKCTLKKYFIDKKIPVNVRNELPLLAKDNEIFLIMGYTVSEKVKITSYSNEILKFFWKT